MYVKRDNDMYRWKLSLHDKIKNYNSFYRKYFKFKLYFSKKKKKKDTKTEFKEIPNIIYLFTLWNFTLK